MQRLTRPIFDGIQTLIRFKNNHGASIICHSHSYGGPEKLYELAHVKFFGPDWNNRKMITDKIVHYDVVGYLTADECIPYLCEIAKIKEKKHGKNTKKLENKT